MLRHLLVTLLLLTSTLVLPVARAEIDINQASAEQLAGNLQGIGLQKAAAIVAYREQNGPFRRVEDLARVKGIGPATVEANRERIRVAEPGSEEK
ncbi:ComEA family DNA-binding protein [Thiohalobacter sp. IOR34]|uniref:ComEA family DNA-binding protein n=1 Tax=Thiohalobacter sp. IOR34 TaxID=3057176 RepID=UPI00339D5ACC